MRHRGIRFALAAAVLATLTACGDDGTTSAWPPPSEEVRWTKVPQAPLGARHEPVGGWVAGRFVVVGGQTGPACPDNASCVATADQARRDGAAFDPATGRWTPIAEAPAPVTGLSVVTAGDRLFILTPDQGHADSPDRLLGYDPDGDEWTTYPSPPQPGQLVPVGDTVAVIPGSDEERPVVDAVLDREANRWRELPDDPLGPSFDREAVAVPGGLLLAAKDLVDNPGSDKPALVRLARLTLGTDAARAAWQPLKDSEIIGWGPVSVAGLVVWPSTGSADGGEVNGWGRAYPEGGIYDPVTGAWRALPPSPAASSGRWCCTGAVLGDRVIVSDHLLDPAAGHWEDLPDLPGRERSSPAVASGAGGVMVWGGATSGNHPENLGDGYLLTGP